MKLSYEAFEEAIHQGREVEFFYNNEKYSITNTSNGWNFMKFHDYDTLQIYRDSNELIKNAKIGSKTLKELWNDIIVDVIY